MLLKLWKAFLSLFVPEVKDRHYWFQDLNDDRDVRRAFLWDGKKVSRQYLQEFVGNLDVKFYPDGNCIVDGPNPIQLFPYTFIWEDSDGYDSSRLYGVIQRFAMYRNPDLRPGTPKAS
ncbi:hypothetical protein MZD04_gp317 [Pseudomonas phage Psa21]|uniref:Uncharacterized protein n=1 Tax=Pseudomonas phage Psa21 TaxID=2530023 RepID=A0A481W631_9CAUD|nr:hypothetical protein MZD04_gp317 [Pseudomonas phage Psa21]QBJ02843.1 hypothetical protein PSA21_317 [Pseudomonas phage Psa21]